MKGKTWRPSGTMEMPRSTIECGDRPSIRSPSNQISPWCAGLRPVMARSDVVLPAPLLPMSAIVSPSSIASDTLRTARTWS